MKIKNFLIFLSIIIFVLVFPSLVFFVSNLAFWPWWNYIFANNINKKLEKIFPNNSILKLKKWDYYYKLWEYDKALENYLKVNYQNNETCFTLNHNIWNTYYKLWDKIESKVDKISLWQKSLSFYSKALNIKQDLETKKNYDFVLEKLRELIKKTDEKPKEDKKDKEPEKKDEKNQTSSWSENKEKQGNPNENNKKQEDSQSQDQIVPKAPSVKIDEKSSEAKNKLSPWEKQEIENYMNSLKEEEKQNIDLNKPKEINDLFDILNNNFFTPFDKNENWW